MIQMPRQCCESCCQLLHACRKTERQSGRRSCHIKLQRRSNAERQAKQADALNAREQMDSQSRQGNAGKQISTADDAARVTHRTCAEVKLWAMLPSLVFRGEDKEEVMQGISWTYDPGRAMQARLLERPQQVNSMNSRASRADPPKKPATTNPSTYPPVEMACRKQQRR